MWAQRLQDAWNSAATTSDQKKKMSEIISSNTVNSATDWGKSASEYFSWRSGSNYDLVEQARPLPTPPSVKVDYGAMRKAAENHIRSKLVDPGSAVFEWPNGFTRTTWRRLFQKPVEGVMTCGYVNSRNRLGGFSGKSAFVVVMDDTSVSFSDIDAGGSAGLVEAGCKKGANILPPPQIGMLDDTPTPPSLTNEISVADELQKSASLRDKGIITNDEFEKLKKIILSR